MKNAKDIAAGLTPENLPATLPTVPALARDVDPGTAEVVNALFRELQSIFPAWKQAWPTTRALDAAKRSWIKGFMSARISTIEQIRLGIEQCRQHGGDFAPSVGRFVKWCQPTPEMLGLPPLERAYAEACRNSHPAADGQWSHPGVYHAACETGFHALRTQSEEVSRRLFERSYVATVRMLLAGEPLREIPKALPKAVTVRTPEVGRAALAGLRQAMRGASHG
jgi:hypothetical protein